MASGIQRDNAWPRASRLYDSSMARRYREIRESFPATPPRTRSLRTVFHALSYLEIVDPYTFHRHQHVNFEIIIIDHGSYRCTLNGQAMQLHRNQVLVVKPGDWHQDFLTPPMGYYGLQVKTAGGTLVPPCFPCCPMRRPGSRSPTCRAAEFLAAAAPPEAGVAPARRPRPAAAGDHHRRVLLAPAAPAAAGGARSALPARGGRAALRRAAAAALRREPEQRPQPGAHGRSAGHEPQFAQRDLPRPFRPVAGAGIPQVQDGAGLGAPDRHRHERHRGLEPPRIRESLPLLPRLPPSARQAPLARLGSLLTARPSRRRLRLRRAGAPAGARRLAASGPWRPRRTLDDWIGRWPFSHGGGRLRPARFAPRPQAPGGTSHAIQPRVVGRPELVLPAGPGSACA